MNASDEDLEFQFTVAKALGANHITAELPAGANAGATLKRVGDMAMKHKMFAAYHTHAQGSMTAFDEAFAISKGNKANVDLGHFVAGGNKGGTPMDFLNKFHDRIGSFHLKDRTLPKNCGLNLAWGTGETPIKEILQLVAKNKWDIPASIELEYAIPAGSDAVQEVRKCVEYLPSRYSRNDDSILRRPGPTSSAPVARFPPHARPSSRQQFMHRMATALGLAGGCARPPLLQGLDSRRARTATLLQ